MEKKTDSKNIHYGHRKRVKQNVSENGFSHLEDHKLLELLLFYSIPQADTNELAHQLITEFGSLDEVFKADINRLKKVNGVGESTAVMLAAMGETFTRVSKVKSNKKYVYKTHEDFKNLAVSRLSNQMNEKVMIFCFDSAKRLKKEIVISEGNESTSSVDVRKAVQAVIDCNATSAVLAHNHPEGACEPSGSDIDSTRAVCVMFRKLGFILADHIIVGVDDSAYSMRSDSMFSQMFY